MIVGICGFKGAGKGEVAKIFERNGFIRLSLASPLKDIVSVSFNLDRTLLEGDTLESRQWRDKPISEWQHLVGNGIFHSDTVITPRLILQRVGTDLYRNNISPTFWIDLMKRRIQSIMEDDTIQCDGIIIDDARFQNELRICDFVIRVDRFDYSCDEIKNFHISEIDHLNFTPDKIINNKSTIENLETQVIDFIHWIQK